jgi:hypothetical protein
VSSYIQSLVKRQIQEWFPNEEVFENYRPEWLIGLEIDIYLPNLNLAIEVDGLQHHFYSKHFHQYKADFEMQVIRDYVKRKILNNEQVLTCRVPHGYNSMNKLWSAVKGTNLNKKIKINKEIESLVQDSWNQHKDIYIENLNFIESYRLTLLDHEWNFCKKLIKNKLYKELYDYMKTHAYIQEKPISEISFKNRVGPL